MARHNSNLVELDIDKLFEEHGIDEILEIEKLLDAEIERKRIELRSMVGDRYKDVLAASDAIKTMTTISQEIVSNIVRISETCHHLVADSNKVNPKATSEVDRKKIEERTLIIQIRLAMFINEHIWVALDEERNLDATQFYLLGLHIHTGLSVTKKEYLDRIPLLRHVKDDLIVLRSRIFVEIVNKLESVEITAQETSYNLNALMLLQNQDAKALLENFIQHRKTALNTVMKTPHPSVRYQVSAMVRCLITTIQLLHDCFISWNDTKRGLIWQKLEEIVSDSSIPTISKMRLPVTPLITYIPEIINQFRPKCTTSSDQTSASETKSIVEAWLHSTSMDVRLGLEKSLDAITNVRGLHIIREEALKIESPSDWGNICLETYLPDDFNVWYCFFQHVISTRAKAIIAKKIDSNVKHVQTYIKTTLSNCTNKQKSESDLRWYIWSEDSEDVCKTENRHTGLTMKTKGYTPSIVQLCEKLDNKYLELLQDVSQYFYGKDFQSMDTTLNFRDYKYKKKFIDKEHLENHFRIECSKSTSQITSFIQDLLKTVKDTDILVAQSIMSARFLQALPVMCPHLKKCCTLNDTSDDWQKLCDYFNKCSLLLWENWQNNCNRYIETIIQKQYMEVSPKSMIQVLAKWDTIEIQEQTEEKVFKSYIKVPLKPSLTLHSILVLMNDELSHVLPHTLPKVVHLNFIEANVNRILDDYKNLVDIDLNQNQALQFLFDVKFLTTLSIPRENADLLAKSQDICDKLRSKIDPFDLDVFYVYLQNNIRRAVCQSQVILGCLLPSSSQLASIGISERNKEQEKDPLILALSIPSTTSWFPLLPVTAPSQKSSVLSAGTQKEAKGSGSKAVKTTPKKYQDPATVMRSSAAALFGGLTTDWFS